MSKTKAKTIACILNFPSHYRQNIYLKMEAALDCDFFFGDIDGNRIKKVDYKAFKKSITQFKTLRLFGHFNWIKNSVSLVNKDYQHYILTGDIYCFSNWTILVLNRILGKKTYLWTHGWYGNEGFIKRLIKKLFFNLSHGLFLYGKYAKNLLQSNGFKANKLHVIYNSLDYEKQVETRQLLKPSNIYSDHFKNEKPTFIFVGRLTKVKNLSNIIECLKASANFNMVFLGDGPEKETLIQLAKQYNVQDNCWFYGACYNEDDIGALIYNADLCVSPGNVGLTAIHALMYGTPVITHNNFANQMPEFEAIVEGKSGAFFKEDDVNDLMREIRNWLAKSENREDIRINCYQMIDKYYNPAYQIKIFKEVLV